MITNDSLDFDDVPPLEDMSHILDIKSKIPFLQTPKAAAQQPKQTKSTEFQGLKKGFFSTTTRPKPKKSKIIQEEIPLIKPQTTRNPLEFDQVRDAMASQLDQSRTGISYSSDWMSPSFLGKIERSTILAKAFQDPRFLQMSQQLARDPVRTLEMCKKEHPEWMEALREFSGMLGEVFEKKANQVDTSGLNDFERDIVERVMKDPKVQEALKDSRIQQLLFDLKSNQNPLLVQQFLKDACPDIQQKVQVLIKSGLLSIQ
jgi:hypothetical protein